MTVYNQFKDSAYAKNAIYKLDYKRKETFRYIIDAIGSIYPDECPIDKITFMGIV